MPTPLPGFVLELSPLVAAGAAADIAELLGTTQHLTMGTWGERFEEAFARAVGTTYAVATATGTAALEIALRAAGVAGREVVVPTITFGATPVAVLRAGGVPVLCDSAPGGIVPGPTEVEQALSRRTVAVVVVHIGGLVDPGTAAIATLCRDRGIVFVEDAAHATGSTAAGRGPGHHGLGAAYSFFNTKVLSCGEGGMLATDDPDVVAIARLLRDHAKDPRGAMATTGYSWRLPEISAVLGVHQVSELPAIIAGRAAVAAAYVDLARREGIDIVEPAQGTASNWYKAIVRTPTMSGDALERGLAARGVTPAGRVYAVPCHRQAAFAEYGRRPFPNADWYADHHVCLPIHSSMVHADVERVVGALAEAQRGA
jgi:perosamine synthetase